MKEKEVPFLLNNFQFNALKNAMITNINSMDSYEQYTMTKIQNLFAELKQEFNPLLNKNNELVYYYIELSILADEWTVKERRFFYHPKKQNLIVKNDKGIFHMNMLNNYVQYKGKNFQMKENESGHLKCHIYYYSDYYYDFNESNSEMYDIEIIENISFFDGYLEAKKDFSISNFGGIIEYKTYTGKDIIPKDSKIFIDINKFGLMYNLIPKMEHNLSNLEKFPYDFSNYWYIGINIKNTKNTSYDFSYLKSKSNIKILILTINDLNS